MDVEEVAIFVHRLAVLHTEYQSRHLFDHLLFPAALGNVRIPDRPAMGPNCCAVAADDLEVGDGLEAERHMRQWYSTRPEVPLTMMLEASLPLKRAFICSVHLHHIF